MRWCIDCAKDSLGLGVGLNEMLNASFVKKDNEDIWNYEHDKPFFAIC